MTEFSEYIINVIEERNIHILNILFLCLSLFAIVSFWESELPSFFSKCVRYGKHEHKGEAHSKSLALMALPKSWFRHFYITALLINACTVYLVVQTTILCNPVPEYAATLLDVIAGGRKNRKVVVDSTSTVIANALMFLHILRRFYESNFVQIFSKSSKINVMQYLLGYCHYLCVILTLIANSEGLVRDSVPTSFNWHQMSYVQFSCIALFLFSWWHQHKSNLILVNLRKKQMTYEAHLQPQGGFFDWVSSPHMLFEILLYAALLGFMGKCVTWWLIVIWVACNQVNIALFTHSWYKETFKKYPKNRKAIIPFIL